LNTLNGLFLVSSNVLLYSSIGKVVQCANGWTISSFGVENTCRKHDNI